MSDDQNNEIDLIAITSDIVASHVANNRVAIEDVPGLITKVYQTLTELGEPEPPVEPVYEPAVSIKKSLADPDRIISMIDGKAYSSLKRHLTTHGLTPDDYRKRFGLSAEYPMVSPGYSARRRELSLASGLGRKKVVEATPAPVEKPEKKPRKARQSPVERLREAKAKGPFAEAQGKAEG